jgi:hypothetical protein
MDPFQQWPELFQHIIDRKDEISDRIGPQVAFGMNATHSGKSKANSDPMKGKIQESPLFAMLIKVHEEEDLQIKYGAVQLQVLHAHWEKLRAFQNDHPNHIGEVRESGRSSTEDERDIKMVEKAALAVRQLQTAEQREWLDELDPFCAPKEFSGELAAAQTRGEDARLFSKRVERYCRTGYEPGVMASGGARVRSAGQYLYLVDYLGRRFGLPTHEVQNPGGGQGQELVVGRHKGKKASSMSRKAILELGLDPLELAASNPTVLTNAEEETSRQESTEVACARTRRFEIDRRLFPWNSQTMRLLDFHRNIYPHLKRMLRLPTPSPAKNAKIRKEFEDDLAVSAVIAIAAETGRGVDEVLRLRVEKTPKSPFAYTPPEPGERNGKWSWDAVSPVYKSERTNPDGAVMRELYPSYPASKFVTDLITRYTNETPHQKDLLFPYRAETFRSRVRAWLRRCDRDTRIRERLGSQSGRDDRRTIGRISRLAWGLLHNLTGGELASVCLVLGMPHPLAQVELFYAILEPSEAASLFKSAQAKLWKERKQDGAISLHDLPDRQRVLGCREFPSMEKVTTTIKWLRDGSREFFRLEPEKFDVACDAELFNRAVMYAVWHQFFCFGTRAINDAYQPLKEFSTKSGIGVLSDKDFATGYKSRIVWASERLRLHMDAIETRLSQLGKVPSLCKPPSTAPMWLLGPANQPVELTPTAIQFVMEKEFPFPVNTPRKVMRNILRRKGMSHTNAEAYMGHWWQGREPFSPFSSFSFHSLIDQLRKLMPHILEKDLGFDSIPGVRTK